MLSQSLPGQLPLQFHEHLPPICYASGTGDALKGTNK